MKADHQWETIYKREGRVFDAPFDRVGELVRDFRQAGCSGILDLGCGSGRHLVHLGRENFKITGVDISHTGLLLAREWLAQEGLQAPLVLGDMRAGLPFGSSSFDGLISTQVIHHALLAEIRMTIDHIWRVLKPGGLAFVTVAGSLHEDTAYEEIEPGTFVPHTGSEAGLPHHMFTQASLANEFSAFRVKETSLRDDGHVVTILAEKQG